MTWLFVGLGVWIAVAIPAAVLIGRAIRVADARRATEAGARTGSGNTVLTDELPAEVAPPWTAPATAPFAPPPPPPPTPSRRRPLVVRASISPSERNPSHRDSDVL